MPPRLPLPAYQPILRTIPSTRRVQHPRPAPSAPPFTFESNQHWDVLRQKGINDPQSSRPPDPGRGPDGDKKDELSDREWDLRVGQAIHHLRETLPSFFASGLVMHPLPFLDPPSSATLSAAPPAPTAQIYSPHIRFSYTPPLPLPPPFPRTLSVEGMTLYIATASIIRHTMSAFYSDLEIDLKRMSVLSPDRRERLVRIGLIVSGWGRVTDARAEYDVNSTYTFSPTTGLIATHRIESIDPAPHISVYEGVRASLQKLVGAGAGAAGVAGRKGVLENSRLREMSRHNEGDGKRKGEA